VGMKFIRRQIKCNLGIPSSQSNVGNQGCNQIAEVTVRGSMSTHTSAAFPCQYLPQKDQQCIHLLDKGPVRLPRGSPPFLVIGAGSLDVHAYARAVAFSTSVFYRRRWLRSTVSSDRFGERYILRQGFPTQKSIILLQLEDWVVWKAREKIEREQFRPRLHSITGVSYHTG